MKQEPLPGMTPPTESQKALEDVQHMWRKLVRQAAAEFEASAAQDTLNAAELRRESR